MRRSTSSPSGRATVRARRRTRTSTASRPRTPSYDALLEDDGVDAVYIALPNALHHEWTMRALAAASTSSARSRTRAIPHEVDEAHDEAERNGLVLTEAYMWRHARQTALLRELLPQRGRAPSGARDVHRLAPARRRRALDTRPRRRRAARPRLLLHQRRAARHRQRARPRARRGAATRARSTGRSPGRCTSTDVTATFQCSLLAPLVNTIDVIGADGVAASFRTRSWIRPASSC